MSIQDLFIGKCFLLVLMQGHWTLQSQVSSACHTFSLLVILMLLLGIVFRSAKKPRIIDRSMADLNTS